MKKTVDRQTNKAGRCQIISVSLLSAASLLTLSPTAAHAWGFFGHQIIGEVAMKHLPADLPEFLRTDLAAFQVGRLSQEADISRDAGISHDADLDPGHFLLLSDDETVLGGPKLSTLPPTRRSYDAAMRAVNYSQYAAGFLPYNIMDGWQQLVRDFALLRAYQAALKYGDKFHLPGADRRDYARLEALRELITLHDLGYWAHFVEDASQPMHVSVHFDGWGNLPNPQGFVTGPGLHAKFESIFVMANIKETDVDALMRPYQHCADTIQVCTQNYLGGTAQWVMALYQLDKEHAFDVATRESKAFTCQRLVDGANMLRDMVTDAWRASAGASLGLRIKTPVADYEAGKAIIVIQSQEY